MNKIIHSDCIQGMKELPDNSVDCCVTSPPYYGLRDYGHDGQIGLEETPEQYVAKMVEVFEQVRRVLKPEGTLFLNLGDSYFSSARRANSYDIYDKAPEDFQGNDCLCESLCGVCQQVVSHTIHIESLLVSMLISSLSYSNPLHKEWQNVHVPTSGLDPSEARTVISILDFVRLKDLSDERVVSFRESMPDLFLQQLLDECLRRGNSSSCLLCARTLDVCDFRHADKRVYTFCTEMLLDASNHCMLGNSFSGLAYNKDTKIKPQSSINLKPKDLIGIPWMVAFALRSAGWYLRQDIIWHKPNPMPESVTDRCTKAHEYIFLMSKSQRYYYDQEAIKQPIAEASIERLSQDVESQEGSSRVPGKSNGNMKAVGQYVGGKKHKNLLDNGLSNHSFHKTRANGNEWENKDGKANKRSVWTVTTKPFKQAHFATFPEDLIVDCIKAGCPEGGTVLDPFGGAGTTAVVARKLNRNYLLYELNPEYIKIAEKRIFNSLGLFA